MKSAILIGSERVETTHEGSDNEMRTDTSYSLDEAIDTQSTVISNDQDNNKNGIDLMSPSLAAAFRSLENQRTKGNLPARCSHWRFEPWSR